MKLRHLPNILTSFRLLLLCPFLITLLNGHYQTTFYIFIIAGFTDGLDGWFARHYQWQSQLGGLLDPLADKLFVAASYITLAYLKQLPWWLVFIVLTRDVIIMSAIAIWEALWGHPEFNPSFLSKSNTVLQGFVIFIALFQLAYFPVPSWFFNGLIGVITVTTLSSFLNYAFSWGIKARNKWHGRNR